MISYTPAVVFGLLRGELVMMRSQQSNLNLVLIKIVETISIMDVKRNFLKCAFLENDFDYEQFLHIVRQAFSLFRCN